MLIIYVPTGHPRCTVYEFLSSSKQKKIFKRTSELVNMKSLRHWVSKQQITAASKWSNEDCAHGTCAPALLSAHYNFWLSYFFKCRNIKWFLLLQNNADMFQTAYYVSNVVLFGGCYSPSLYGHKLLKTFFNYLHLCSEDKKKNRTSWGWVNDDRNVIFGVYSYLSCYQLIYHMEITDKTCFS